MLFIAVVGLSPPQPVFVSPHGPNNAAPMSIVGVFMGRYAFWLIASTTCEPFMDVFQSFLHAYVSCCKEHGEP
jgi:hypothetical protein